MKKLTGSRIGNLIVVAAVVIIPLLYAGLLTLAYQNPTNRLETITAAVVNEDQPYTATLATGETETLDLGDQLEEALTSPDEGEDVGFTWTSMPASQAEADMRTEDVRAILYIPADFSQKASLVGTDDPESATTQTLRLVTDDGVNYLAGTMAKTVASELSNRLEQQGSDKVLSTLLLSVSTIRDGMVEASDGATALASGAAELDDGASSLSSGSEQLADGTSTLTVGLAQLADGSVTLTEGLTTLSTGTATAADGAQQLADGTQRLADGASTASSGASSLADGASTASSGASSLADGASALAAGTSTLAESTAPLADGVSSLADGASTLTSGVTAYTQGVDAVAAGASTLKSKAAALPQGVAALSAGVGSSTDAYDPTSSQNSLYAGINAVSAGASQLSSSMSTSTSSSTSLVDGVAGYTGAVDSLAAACKTAGDPSATCAALQRISAQSAALNSGAQQAADGAEQLASATQALTAGAARLRGGVDQLSAAVGTATDVTVARDSSSPQTVMGGINAVAGGLSQITTTTTTSGGTTTTTDNSAALRDGATALSSGLDTLEGRIPALTSGVRALDEGAARVSAGASSLASGVDALSSGASSLASGVDALSSGATTAASSSQQLADGVARLSSGAASAASGSQTLGSGLQSAASGAVSLDSGAQELSAGAERLADGTSTLLEGSDTLASGLADGVDRIPDYSEAQRDAITETASDIAGVESVRDHAVANNGAGFTPMFMSLALWVGAIALFLVLPALDKREHGEHWWASATRPAATALLLAVAQAIIMMVAVNAAGELHSANLLGLCAMAIAASITFMAINQACVASLAFRGRFVSIILLSLQITSMGATFPVETTPRFFQWIHPFLPMSYTQLSFRRLIAGAGVDGIFLQTLGVLAIWALIGVAVTLVGARFRRGRHPLPADNALAPTAA